MGKGIKSPRVEAQAVIGWSSTDVISSRQGAAVKLAVRIFAGTDPSRIRAITLHLARVARSDNLTAMIKRERTRIRNVFERYLPGSRFLYWIEVSGQGLLHLHGLIASRYDDSEILSAIRYDPKRHENRTSLFRGYRAVSIGKLHDYDDHQRHIGIWAWYSTKRWTWRVNNPVDRAWLKQAFASVDPKYLVGQIGTRRRTEMDSSHCSSNGSSGDTEALLAKLVATSNHSQQPAATTTISKSAEYNWRQDQWHRSRPLTALLVDVYGQIPLPEIRDTGG